MRRRFINDVVVVVEDGDREFVAAQIFPDVFDWIELRRVGWQTDKGDVFGDRERGSNMIARAVEDESGVATCRLLSTGLWRSLLRSLIDGTSARCWVQGCRVSQLRLRHLTCGRASRPAPECLMHEA